MDNKVAIGLNRGAGKSSHLNQAQPLHLSGSRFCGAPEMPRATTKTVRKCRWASLNTSLLYGPSSMDDAVRPVSSFNSRRAQSSKVSPNSRQPPGAAQVPSPRELTRLPSSKRRSRTTKTPTPTRGSFWLELDSGRGGKGRCVRRNMGGYGFVSSGRIVYGEGREPPKRGQEWPVAAQRGLQPVCFSALMLHIIRN